MPPSQLKRLKSSLREAGVTAPQKSKKQKKSHNSSTSNPQQRQEQLQKLRESFNPFEVRAPSSRPAKHQHATNGYPTSKYKDVLHRPGVTKSAGEEMRRAKLLPELQRRHKVGGLIDRRIGEGDIAMTAEERAVQRFAAEKGRKRGRSTFDLEGSDDDEIGGGLSRGILTHGGRALDDLPADDFGEEMNGRADSDVEGDLLRRKKRKLEDEPDVADENDEREQPDRQKSRKEVMEEVIAKSKFHKYERQKAKEDDDDLRDELDKGMDEILAVLKGQKVPRPIPAVNAAGQNANDSGATMNPDRLKLLEGMDREQADREYDARLRQLAQDAKAKPSDRSKTEEEKIREEAERLKDLEERRLRRMKGEDDSDVEADGRDAEVEDDDGDDDVPDEAAQFGFTLSETPREQQESKQIVLEDEDEFALDEDLVASGSDIDISEDESETGDASPIVNGEEQIPDDEEDEFVKDILGDVLAANASNQGDGPPLAYTYPCPRSHSQLIDIVKDQPIEQLPTIIQRIRALHHSSLNATNKESMADFSAVLVEHISYMGLQSHPLHAVEQVIRHLHSLSRTYPGRIAAAFRAQLKSAHERKDLQAGDLVILTAIGSIYPTSDHWHQIVTPAMTLIARWLGVNIADHDSKAKKGAFLVALCVKFQSLSKRVVPEALSFTLRALRERNRLNAEMLNAHVENLMAMAKLWNQKTAFIEMFTPALPLLKKAGVRREQQILQILLNQARLVRRPLELHHHRPLAIRSSYPKFEEGFNPDKHYDPDKERSDSRKLQKEYKRERKGALRELKKDARFIDREKLREKKERDAEYEKKYRRLVAEVQGEAGHDAKEYEKEKARGRNRGGGRAGKNRGR